MKPRSAFRDSCERTFWVLIFSPSAIAVLIGAPSGILVGLTVALVVVNTIVMWSAR
jgi:hypothetical protein